MTETDFDRCPECDAYPTFGIRRHPKFSMKVEVKSGQFWDLVPVYTHSRESLLAVYHLMGKPDFATFEEWTGEKWVEFQPTVGAPVPEPEYAPIPHLPWLTEDDVP